MSEMEKTEILKTFANFPPETKFSFAAGYAAAKAEEANSTFRALAKMTMEKFEGTADGQRPA